MSNCTAVDVEVEGNDGVWGRKRGDGSCLLTNIGGKRERKSHRRVAPKAQWKVRGYEFFSF